MVHPGAVHGLLGGSPALDLQAFRSWGAREWPPLPSSARVEEGRGLYHLSLLGRRGEQGSPGVPSGSDFSTRLGQEEA